jgi:DNA-binding NarL/FixJ family response regulator
MIKLFIEDDHALLREGLARLFDGADDIALIGEAKDGDEVLRRVREGGIDVLLLDLCMPGRCGMGLIRDVVRVAPALPVLVLSMHEESQFALHALGAGARGYLSKESDFRCILAAVRRVAGGGIYLSAGVGEQLVWHGMPADCAIAHRRLTAREREVFLMLVEGKSISGIAGRLDLSVKTVSTHKTRVMHKINVGSMAEMVQYALAHHLLP